ncbi:hypothetical protein DFH28DRAFT_930229 [Melampsora americana]|nr:hypothetical protein DFH28DRAFT_930229 [Melampsora americana]
MGTVLPGVAFGNYNLNGLVSLIIKRTGLKRPGPLFANVTGWATCQAPSSSALDPSLESSYQQEDDDQFYLNLATKTQLSRLKRNHLFNLTHHLISSSPSTTTHSIDHEALTKDALISLILDSRSSRSSQRSIGLKRKSDEDEERDELGGSSDDSDDRRRESDRKVKFGDPHTTPIVHRTRATTTHTSTHSNHDSNSKEPIIGRLTRSKSKSALTTELVINPSPKSARKLRNGKVIRKDFLGKKHDSRNSNSNRGESEEEEGSADDELENESELEEEEEEEEEEEDLGEASVKASSVEENEDEEENGEDGNEDEDEDEEQGTIGLICIDYILWSSKLTIGFDDGYYTEEEVNLADATSKRLLRLKRDNLIKLCEERELERNTNENDGFSQSSDLYPSFEDEDEADNDESVIGSQANQQVESSSSEVEVNVNEEDEEEEVKLKKKKKKKKKMN